MEKLKLDPFLEVAGCVRLPGSKSLSNRTLLIAAAADGDTHIENLLISDDTRYMIQALQKLDIKLDILDPDSSILVHGKGKNFLAVKNQEPVELFLGNAGTAMRPLTAFLAVKGFGDVKLIGEDRMYERPIGPLVETLVAAGCQISFAGNIGFPPIVIHPKTLCAEELVIDGSLSSQYTSSVIMAAPLSGRKLTVHLKGDIVSRPYIDLTLSVMSSFGIDAGWQDSNTIVIPQGSYHSPGKYLVEGDASAASYFLAAGAIRGEITVFGVGKDSIQGDKSFADVLSLMGAEVTYGESYIKVKSRGRLQGVDVDLNHIPDAAMTVAILAIFCESPTRIRNIYNWRLKETDRLHAMATELRKIGAIIEEGRDYLQITPGKIRHADIETYNDHRMAMCFSLVAMSGCPVTILDPGCVSKTFPKYFDVLKTIVSQ